MERHENMERVEYELIIEQYSDMVTRIAIMNVKNIDDAKDYYQNIFMKLYCCKKSLIIRSI